MHAAEVEKGHVQMNRSLQMFERFAEAKAQARKAAQMRSDAEIGPLHMRCADVFELGIAADWDWDRRDNLGGVVPLRPFGVRLPVELQELGEVNIGSEVFFDGSAVDVQPICRDLKAADNALTEVADERQAINRIALSDKIGQDELRFGVNGHPDVLIAPFGGNVAVKMAFFGVYKGPEFVRLHESRSNASNFRVKQSTRLSADRQKQRENRALVNASDTGYGANAHSLKQERNDLSGGFCGDVVPSKRLMARRGECGLAGRTAKTLDSVRAVETKPLRFGVLATYARHGLLFLREKPYNQGLGSDCGLRPLLDSALPPVDAGGGAFLFCPGRFAVRPFSHEPGQAAVSTAPVSQGTLFPFVERVPSFSFDFQFSAFHEPRKDFIDRGHRVLIGREVESLFFKFLSHMRSSHAVKSGDLSNSVRNAKCRDRFPERDSHDGQCLVNSFSEIFDFQFLFVHLYFEFRTFVFSRLQASAKGLQRVIHIFHEEKIPVSRDVVNKKKQTDTDINWDSIINDAERQIEGAEDRIKVLRGSITFFKEQRAKESADSATRN